MANQNYDNPLNVRTTKEQGEKLKEISKIKTTSQASLIRQWIDDNYKKLKP